MLAVRLQQSGPEQEEGLGQEGSGTHTHTMPENRLENLSPGQTPQVLGFLPACPAAAQRAELAPGGLF